MASSSPADAVVLVAACGNAQAGDDAFGPRVTARLREENVHGAILLDLELRPAALLDHLPGPGCLILVDAVLDREAAVREIVDLDWIEVEPLALQHDDALSSHGLGLADQVRLAGTLGVLPARVRVVGMRTSRAAWEHGDDEELTQIVEEAARRIAARITAWRDAEGGAPDFS